MRKNTPFHTTRHLLVAAGLILTFEASSLGRTTPQTTEAVTGATWKLVAASGQVESRVPAALPMTWTRASRGESLVDRSWVRTGTDGRATLAQGSYIVMVEPDTEIQLISSSAPGVPTRVEQQSGSATYRVRKGRQARFQVITPYLVAGVKGTVFHVDVTDSFADVDVSQGVVEVWSRHVNDSVDIGAGESFRVDAAPGQRPQMMVVDDRRARDSASIDDQHSRRDRSRTDSAGRQADGKQWKHGDRDREHRRGDDFGSDDDLDDRAGDDRDFRDEDDLKTFEDMTSFEKSDGASDLLDEIEEEDERDFFLDESTKDLDDDIRVREEDNSGSGSNSGPGSGSPTQEPTSGN